MSPEINQICRFARRLASLECRSARITDHRGRGNTVYDWAIRTANTKWCRCV